MIWDSERALDECQDMLDLAAFDARCADCGAFYDACDLTCCQLCGGDLEPVEDIPL